MTYIEAAEHAENIADRLKVWSADLMEDDQTPFPDFKHELGELEAGVANGLTG